MLHNLSFRARIPYDASESGINIQVRLARAQHELLVPAKVDTGASNCVFKRGVGEALGLSIETGLEETFSTAGGPFRAYGHEVILSTPGFENAITVFFAADDGYARNVLGRCGWLDRMRIGIVDYDGLLYISGYDDED